MGHISLKWKLGSGAAAVAAVVGLSLWHILKVGEPTTFFDYFVLDVVFLPPQVILVSIIVERVLHAREKRELLRKLNMVVGAFFSEVGAELLRRVSGFCANLEELAVQFDVSADWNQRKYWEAIGRARA